MRRSLRLASLVALTIFPASCGDEGTGSSGVPVVNTPPPAPTPSPTPSPSPSPSPSVTGIGGAVPGERLEGVEACARDQVTRDARGRVTGLTLTSAKIDNHLQIDYRAIDSYSLDANGFGGPSFVPADKQAWTGGPYDQFVNSSQDEFYIFRDGQFGRMSFAVLGAEYQAGACYFAVGLRSDTFPTSLWEYSGWTDGLARIGTRTLRLFDHGAKILPDSGARTGTLQLTLVGRESPFGDFHAQPPADIAIVTAPIAILPDGRLDIGPLSGGGFSGSINGRLVTPTALSVGGSGGAGAIFSFELRNAQGDFIFGVVAAGANLI
jgi:hypothetical protein